MGKKGRRCKTRWRRLPMGGERPDEAEEEDCCEGSGDCPVQCPSAVTALGGRERGKGGGGGGSDGAASPLQNGTKQATTVSSSMGPHHAPYKSGGGAGGQRGGGRSGFSGKRNGVGGGAAVTDGSKKGAPGGSGSVYTFNEDEYTKITTPRQDVLFKKGYLMARKKETPSASTNGFTTSTEATNGETAPNGTSGPHNGDTSSSSDQTYSAQVSGSGAEDDNGGANGYTYVNGYANGYSYGSGGYHLDQGGAVPNGGAYFVNGGSYELYDPYAAAAAAAAAAAGYAFPYVGAPPPHPPPPHTLPSLHAIDWYTSRPPGSTGNVADVQWCHLVPNPGFSETRRKRYSTDSQNCSPPSSESTGPPGSPQEEAVSSSGGDPCHAHQPIPQYHHAHVFQGPHPHAATYVYPGYLFGPAVYSVNGVPLAAAPIHPLHGISQSIHVHPSAAVAAPTPVPGPQGNTPVSTAPGSDGGSQRRRKKKRRRKRKRGLTDDASEETSSEVGEEEGVNASGTCGGGGSRGEEFDEVDEDEDDSVVVVRLGNVVPLVMNQQPQSVEASTTSQPFPQDEGAGREEDEEANDIREGEASSTDCSELSGHPESSSVSGGEEVVQQGDIKGRDAQADQKGDRLESYNGNEKSVDVLDEIIVKDGDIPLPLNQSQLTNMDENRDVNTKDIETKEVLIQSLEEMVVQVNEPVTLPSPPTTLALNTHVPEVSVLEKKLDDITADNNLKECSKLSEVEALELLEGEPISTKERQNPSQHDTIKQKRRNGGKSRNSHKLAPVLHPTKTESEQKVVELALPKRGSVEDVIEKTEASEPIKSTPDSRKVLNTDQDDLKTNIKITSARVEEKSLISCSEIKSPVEMDQIKEDSEPSAKEPILSKEELMRIQAEKPIVKDFAQTDVSAQELALTSKSLDAGMMTETRVEQSSLFLPEIITLKPESYKHPMINTTEIGKKEDKLHINTDNSVIKVKEEPLVENHSETVCLDKLEGLPPSSHLQDMPRRKARLKKPPEREQTPGLVKESAEEEEDRPEEEMTVINMASNSHIVAKELNEIENKDEGPDSGVLPAVAPQSFDDDTSKEITESLTDVVCKWLEENSDALPESIEEIKVQEKTEEEEGKEEESLTGPKNGVGNPFPAPSNSSVKEKRNVCERVSEGERVCVLNVSANEVSRDGPVKRVANHEIEIEGKVKCHKSKEGESESKVEDGNISTEEESCEWEPMTVETPKKNFTDLETWKRLRSIGGSSEVLKSLGSCRGTDDEEEEENRKVRLSMCDPTSSVAKYYCLGGGEMKSPSKGEECSIDKEKMQAVVPTDSGVQSDEEDETIATGEEAVEDMHCSMKTRAPKTIGLGKTAAFVVRQIGTTDSPKGPFPCGICCIIQ